MAARQVGQTINQLRLDRQLLIWGLQEKKTVFLNTPVPYDGKMQEMHVPADAPTPPEQKTDWKPEEMITKVIFTEADIDLLGDIIDEIEGTKKNSEKSAIKQ